MIQHTKFRSEIIAELKQTVSINVKPSQISHEVLPYLIEPKQITENYGTFGEYGIKSCLLVACIRKRDYSGVSENLKFGPISHILAMLEIQVIATLAPPIISERPCSGIYFSVRIVQIGPEMAKSRSLSFGERKIQLM